MRDYALFINGVYESVLMDILDVQTYLPELPLFLQPYSSMRIVRLADKPPTVDDPVRVFFSLTNDLKHIYFTGELIGWRDKFTLQEDELMIMNRLIYMFQRTESGVYKEARGIECKNLLMVRRLKKFSTPFSVQELNKISTDEPLSPDRTTSGGWSYVENLNESRLQQWL